MKTCNCKDPNCTRNVRWNDPKNEYGIDLDGSVRKYGAKRYEHAPQTDEERKTVFAKMTSWFAKDVD